MLLGGVALACVACHDCSEMGCSEATTVRFEPALSEPGTYEVVFRSEGAEHVCANTDFEGGVWSCNGPQPPTGILDSTGYENPPAIELGGVRLGGRLERITVIVTKDGTELLTQEVKPTFVDDEPNGPGCGICSQGEGVVEVR